MTHKLLEAPTEDIAHMIQAQLVVWLNHMKETRAATWFAKEWTGEHGNYTNASAGYVGNNKSTGAESHWKYLRRDTIGTAGSSKRMSIKVWLPLLHRYLEALSKRHDSKMLCPKTGFHPFPTEPVISSKLWARVHKFNVNRLMLSHVAGGAGPNKVWEDELCFFLDMHEAHPDMTFVDMLAQYHKAGKYMRVPRTSLGAIYMPTMELINHMKRCPLIVTMEDADNHVEEALVRYETLFDQPYEFLTAYPAISPMDALEVMESFVRVTPLATKVGDMTFLCVCADAYQSYACVESLVLSMLFNPDLEVPDNLREKQLKDRERMKLANPFTTKRPKEKTKAQEAAEAAHWNPKFASFSAPQAGSAVAMAMAKSGPKRTLPVRPAEAEEVMQRPVDPGLLFKSKAGRSVRPVQPIKPRHPQGRPTAATVARKRVRFQDSARTVMVLTLC